MCTYISVYIYKNLVLSTQDRVNRTFTRVFKIATKVTNKQQKQAIMITSRNKFYSTCTIIIICVHYSICTSKVSKVSNPVIVVLRQYLIRGFREVCGVSSAISPSLSRTCSVPCCQHERTATRCNTLQHTTAQRKGIQMSLLAGEDDVVYTAMLHGEK